MQWWKAESFMREVDGWRFLGYYGVVYLAMMVVIILSSFFSDSFIKPIASIVFPIAGDNSLFKTVLVTTGMYWGCLLFYTLFIQKIKIKF